MGVAHSIERGIVSEVEAGPEVMRILAPCMDFLRSQARDPADDDES